MVFGSLRIIIIWLAWSTPCWNKYCSPCSSELIRCQIRANEKIIDALTPRHLLFMRTLMIKNIHVDSQIAHPRFLWSWNANQIVIPEWKFDKILRTFSTIPMMASRYRCQLSTKCTWMARSQYLFFRRVRVVAPYCHNRNYMSDAATYSFSLSPPRTRSQRTGWWGMEGSDSSLIYN